MDSARKVVSEALALEEAGTFAIIIEAVPAELSTYTTTKLRVLTFCIGGGPGCSGQLLVTPDVLGLYDTFTPEFPKQYQQVGALMHDTLKQYTKEVLSGKFPEDKHC